jgi:hypothetical protein
VRVFDQKRSHAAPLLGIHQAQVTPNAVSTFSSRVCPNSLKFDSEIGWCILSMCSSVGTSPAPADPHIPYVCTADKVYSFVQSSSMLMRGKSSAGACNRRARTKEPIQERLVVHFYMTSPHSNAGTVQRAATLLPTLCILAYNVE